MRTLFIFSLLLSLSSCKPKGSKTYFIENDSRYTIYIYNSNAAFSDSLKHGTVKNLRVISELSDLELIAKTDDTAAIAAGISRITSASSIEFKRDLYLNSNWAESVIDDHTYQYTLKIADKDFD